MAVVYKPTNGIKGKMIKAQFPGFSRQKGSRKKLNPSDPMERRQAAIIVRDVREPLLFCVQPTSRLRGTCRLHMLTSRRKLRAQLFSPTFVTPLFGRPGSLHPDLLRKSAFDSTGPTGVLNGTRTLLVPSLSAPLLLEESRIGVCALFGHTGSTTISTRLRWKSPTS